MNPELKILRGERLELKPILSQKFRGTRLPGTQIFRAENKDGEAIIQEYHHPMYVIGCRFFRFFRTLRLSLQESHSGIRFEAILSGEFQTVSAERKKEKLSAGQYRFSDTSTNTLKFKKGMDCTCFVTHYSPELLQQIGFRNPVLPTGPRRISREMNELIRELLHNPYDEGLRHFFYENSVREILFLHLKNPNESLPGELNEEDLAAIYNADAIIQQNLPVHISIHRLSKMTGTNEFKLKRGFRKVFGMGIFERLIYRRMFYARELLESSNKSIDAIGRLSGYASATGFITAFRKRFGKTPLQWRKEKREEPTD